MSLNTPFEWTPECRKALNMLIEQVTSDPVLWHPDPNAPFELQVDTSDFALGSILFQRDENGKHRAVAYHSQALIAAERNYGISDKELLAIVEGLKRVRHLVIGSPHKLKIFTDHDNLRFYRHPQKLNRRVARYIAFLADFNFELEYLPGKQNKADPLSRCPDYDKGAEDNKDTVALPDSLFVRVMEITALEQQIDDLQKQNQKLLESWKKKHDLYQDKWKVWWRAGSKVILTDQGMYRTLIQQYHDLPMAAHPGTWKTSQILRRDYWWPSLGKDMEDYIRGCATCQATKAITHCNVPPIAPIGPGEDNTPFLCITVDFIMKLPELQGCDTILTITDHDCTKAVILILCREDMGSEEVARLFQDHAFPYTGIPKRIISDRDPRFTSQFFKELCDQLDIKQNISSAYHPQTDGQLERTNQTLETILRIYCNHQQDNWADWLKIAQYVINCRPSSTTKKPPYELWMGFIPRTHQPACTGNVPALEERKSRLLQARNDAQEAISKAQSLWQKSPHFLRYHVDQQVWLEGTHLCNTHPTHKLRAKRFGPFKVLEVLSPVTYRLELPANWKIHNAFHAAVLHPYKEMAIHGPNFPEPPPDLVEGQEEWEVDNVLASRRHGRSKALQYLIKWKGFSEAHNSWEPKRNLGNADQLVKEFHDKNPRAIRRMIINPTDSDMSSQLLPDISSLIHHFKGLSLMSAPETSYPSPSVSEREAILTVDTTIVAEVISDMCHTDTPPPTFPEEPPYTNLEEVPPTFEMNDYLRLSPSLVSVHGPSRPPTPLTIMMAAMEAGQENNEPLPVPPRLGEQEYYAAQLTHPTPADNPQDPRNLLTGVTEPERQRMFRSINGLRDAILSLMRQEDEEELNVPSLTAPTIAPEMLMHCGHTTLSTESSVTSSAPSHLSVAVDEEDSNNTHPSEDWIRFIPEIHRTGTLIPISEAYPEERVLAHYIRFHVDQTTGEPTISGTMGRGCPTYGDTLMAAPIADPTPANHHDHRYFKMFEEQSMICGPVNWALEDLGDYGVLGDVIRYRGQTAQRRHLAHIQMEVEALEDYAQQRRANLASQMSAYQSREVAIRRHLIMANTHKRISRLLTEDQETGELAWRHRRTIRQDYSRAHTFRLQGGHASSISSGSSTSSVSSSIEAPPTGRTCIYCHWPGHLAGHCDTPHYICSEKRSGYCRVPTFHRNFNPNMPNICPYGGRRKHATHTYRTQGRMARYLSLAERAIEYEHVGEGCDDTCKGHYSRAARCTRAAIERVVDQIGHSTTQTDPVHEAPYAPRTPTPDYVPADNEGNDEL